MKIRTTLIASSLIASNFATCVAQAALQSRDLDGNFATAEAYYDTELNITWMAHANSITGTNYDDAYITDGSHMLWDGYKFVDTTIDGMTSWYSANAWAADLSFTDGLNVYDNWRLPATPLFDATCSNQTYIGGDSFMSTDYGCTGSELGHLFYNELGGVPNLSINLTHNQNYSLFTNIQEADYWSSEFDLASDYAAGFYMANGYQSWMPKNFYRPALAVSDGDIGTPITVPEPHTSTLLLAGLALVGAAMRRRCC